MPNDLQREYQLRFQDRAAYRIAVWHVLTHEFFNRWVAPTATVLDLGCGWGEFINQVVAGKKYGMDLNPDGAGRLGEGVVFLHQDCSAAWPLPDDHLDVVFTSNFFEHLPDKECLRRTLGHAWRCLKPGGRLVCLGPNIRLLPGRYWDFWDHYLPLSERSLAEVLNIVGFHVELSVARFLPFTMSEAYTTPPVFFLRVYLRLPLAWRLFGQQFLVVARKPAPAE